MKFRRFTSRVVAVALIGSLLAGVALVAGPVAPASATVKGSFGGFFSDENKVYSNHSKWMTDLPDALMLGELSIPASHDSASIIDNNTSQAQAMSIPNQLKAGLRMFDIRYVCKAPNTAPGVDGRTEDSLRVYHGANSQEMDVSTVFEDFEDFLQANPGEFLMLSLGDESSNDPLGQTNQDTCDGRTDDDVAALKTRYDNLWYQDQDNDGLEDRREATIYGTKFAAPDPDNAKGSYDTDGDGITDADEIYTFHTSPLVQRTNGTDLDSSVPYKGTTAFQYDVDGDGKTYDLQTADPDRSPPRLGEMRGTVVDYKKLTQVTSNGIPDSHTDPDDDDHGEWKVCTTPVDGCAYLVQGKIDAVNTQIDHAHFSGDKSALWISDAVGSTFIIPQEAAAGSVSNDSLNQGVFDYLKSHIDYTKVGIINMDFPGPGLIDRIIHFNQKYGLSKNAVDPANQDPRYEVGVIKTEGTCGNQSENLSIRMDTEDDNPSNTASGWIGDTEWDSHFVKLNLCRVNGADFHPPTAGFYGVLKLGLSCPPGSNELQRKLDNEDTNNNNQRSGDPYADAIATDPNSFRGGPGPGTSTYITICSFNAADRQPGDGPAWPELGFPYGVFGSPSTGVPYIDFGYVQADDEDSGNGNESIPDFDSSAWGGMLSGRLRYTVFHFIKAMGAGVSLTSNPTKPTSGAINFEQNTSAPIVVTARDPQGNPAILLNNPSGLDQHITFVVEDSTASVHQRVPLDSQGRATYDATNLPVGAHTLRAVYTDGRGHFGLGEISLPLNVTAEGKPVISMSSPKVGQLVGISSFNSCASTVPGTGNTGVCGHATSDGPIESVHVNVKNATGKWWDGSGFNANAPLTDNTTLHTQFQPTPPANNVGFFLPIPPAAMSTGTYTVQVDAAEAVSTTTTSFPFTFDASPPVFTFSNPAAQGATVSYYKFGENCPAPAERGLCGYVVENEGPIGQIDVALSHNGGSPATYVAKTSPVPGVPGKWVWWVPLDGHSMAGGNYVVSLHTIDAGDNEVPTLDPGPGDQRGFALDAEPPDVHVTLPTNNAKLDATSDWPLPCDGSTGARKVGRFCGTATDDAGVTKVQVRIVDAKSHYFDFTTNTWDTAANDYRPAVLKTVATSAGPWSFEFPGTLPDGRYFLGVQATDGVGGQVSNGSTVFYDTTAPVVTVTKVGLEGGLGWFTSDVSFKAEDKNAVTDTTCSATPASATAETATGTGTAKCTDAFGRVGTASFSYKIDKTKPSAVSITPTPAAVDGWYRSMPSLTFTGTDNLDTSPECKQLSIANITNGKRVTAQCADDAGNVKTGSRDFLIDAGKPTVTVAALSDPNGSNGWYTSAPKFRATGVDALSGLGSCDPDLTYAGSDVAGTTVTMSCTDKVGNVGQGTSPQFSVDREDPFVFVTVGSAADGTNGWFKTKPTMNTSGVDLTSGVVPGSCTAPYTYAGPDSASANGSGSCADYAGHTKTASSNSFKVDTTAPVVSVAPSSAPDGTNGWYKTAPTLRTTGTDATSGVASCSGDAPWTGGDTAGSTVGGSCTDKAGNAGSGTSASFKVDTTAPSVACPATAPTYFLKQTVSMTPTVSDALSGAAAPAAAPVNTGAVGSFMNTLTGKDNAGNVAMVQCPYTVTYKIDVSGPGISPTVRPGQGAAFLVKLLDGTGKNVSARNITLTLTSGVNRNEKFNWAGTGYRLTHRTSFTPGTYTITFTVSGDPTPHSFQYTTKYGR